MAHRQTWIIFLLLIAFSKQVSGQSNTRCYNEKFDSLMCLPGSGISVQNIIVYASTTGRPTGLCHKSRDNCTQCLTHNSVFFIRARSACDGRLTCDNLAADLDRVYCGISDTRVDLSYITIWYTCEPSQTEDFRYVSSCFKQTFDNLACDGGTVIDVTDVYVGVTDVTTGGCPVVYVGGCVHRSPDTAFITMSYRELCNGRVECRDARAYDRAGICGSTAETQYTMIGYECVPPTGTRCYNEIFDSLMCLPGTGISVQRINVYASTTGGPTGLCQKSRDNCTEILAPSYTLSIRARAACDGRLSCGNLTANVNKVYCGDPDTGVDLSYITIKFICEAKQSEDMQHVTRCTDEGFDTLMCTAGKSVRISDVFVGSRDRDTCSASVGACHLADSHPVVTSYRQQCDGRPACKDATVDGRAGVCGVGADRHFTMVVYQCVQENLDFRYVSSCFNQTFDNFACDGGTVIDVTDVYVGVTEMTTGGCSMVPVGGCVYRVPDTAFFPKSLRDLCTGRVECRDVRAYDSAGICQSTAETQYMMIGYQCVTSGGTNTDATESTDPSCVDDGRLNSLCRSTSENLQTPHTTGLPYPPNVLALAVALPVVVLCATAIAVGVVFGIKRRNRQKQNAPGSSLTPTEHIYANTEAEYVNQNVSLPERTPDEIPLTTGEISSERVQYENIPAAAPATYEEVNRVQADQDTAPQYTSLSVPHRGVQGPGHTSYVNVSLPQNAPGDGDAEDVKYMSIDRSPK